MRFILAFLLTGALWAAGPAGPVAGFTLDSRTATIRAITGLPGALRLADPVTLPFGVASAEFTPTGDAALVITAEQPAHLFMIRALSSSPVWSDLGEVADGSRILGLNRKGTAALLYSPAEAGVRFAKTLAATPSLSATIPVPYVVSAGLLEDNGQCAVIGNTTIDTLCADGTTHRILDSPGLQVVAIAFGVSGRDLWIADAGTKQISRIADYAQQSNTAVFATAADGIAKPVALSVTFSGQVLIADADAPALLTIDPSGLQSTQTFVLSVAPSQLRPLTDPTMLLINDLSALPFTLFATSEMRTYFVPAN